MISASGYVALGRRLSGVVVTWLVTCRHGERICASLLGLGHPTRPSADSHTSTAPLPHCHRTTNSDFESHRVKQSERIRILPGPGTAAGQPVTPVLPANGLRTRTGCQGSALPWAGNLQAQGKAAMASQASISAIRLPSTRLAGSAWSCVADHPEALVVGGEAVGSTYLVEAEREAPLVLRRI